jgi:hypothetical protein
MRKTSMRKAMLALAAIATLGGAALAPTSASAWGWHGGWHRWHGGWGWGYRSIYNACTVRTWVYTPYGPVARWINRCY